MRQPRSSPGAQSARKVAVCARVALGDDEVVPVYEMYNKSTVRRRPRRRLSRGGAALVWSIASLIALAGCGGSSHRHGDAPTTTDAGSTTSSPSTSTTLPAAATQAFDAYQHAFGVIAAIAGDPNGRSTDPRLNQVLVDPFYSEVIQEINVYRLRDEVVHGSYSFANFHLDSITADGRVIFTDCQTNSQVVYSAKTGAVVGNAGTSRIPEQVVAYKASPSADFKIADDNQGSAIAAARDACAP